MQLRPENVVFFCKQSGGPARPTVTIYEDGTYKQHRPFKRARSASICLDNTASGEPTRKQLDLAEQFASAAIKFNPVCRLEFGPSTSPWTFDFLSHFGEDFADGYGGEGLRWGKKGSRASGPLRSRRKPSYEPRERT